MYSFLLEEIGDVNKTIFDVIKNFLVDVGRKLTMDYIMAIILGLMLLTFILVFVVILKTYEYKVLKNVLSINKFLIKNPNLTDDNLVELNKKMKMVPKTFRFAWQEYVLNRDKMPSEYMSTLRCIDQPSKNSTLSNILGTTSTLMIILALFSILLTMYSSTGYTITADAPIDTYMKYLLPLPILVLILSFIIIIFFRVWYSTIVKDLYDNFHEFERLMNKSCSTMPAYIDYEVLFTQKEIKDGIPVLQEYLEKRAIQEQREKEELEINSIKFEDFNFDEVGVENALLLERAMRECEKYYNVKHSLTENIISKENEINNFQKNFDNVTKEFERKTQSIKENIAQLTQQLNNTTIKIEANYINKRKNDEQKKFQELEKEYELAATRFKKQQEELEAEVEKYKEEIAGRKQIVEESMLTEGKSYANKVYGHINKTVTAQNEPYMKKLEEEKKNLEDQLETLNQTIAVQQAEINVKNDSLIALEKELNIRLSEVEAVRNVKEYLNSEEFRDRVLNKKRRKENDRTIGNINYEEEEVESLKKRLEVAENLIAEYKNIQSKNTIEKEQPKNISTTIESVLPEKSEVKNIIRKVDKPIKPVSIDKLKSAQKELEELQKSINSENAQFVNNKNELKKNIDETISTLDNKQNKS